MPVPDFFNLNRTTPPLLIVHKGDKVASDAGHGTLKKIEYFEDCNRIADAIIELDLNGEKEHASYITKSLYQRQKTVGEKLAELRKFSSSMGIEGSGGVTLGSASFVIAYLIEDKKEEIPQLDYDDNLELLCETLPYIIGHRTAIITGEMPINKELNQKYFELKKGLGLDEEEGRQILYFNAGLECAIYGKNSRIGGCIVCRAADNCP